MHRALRRYRTLLGLIVIALSTSATINLGMAAAAEDRAAVMKDVIGSFKILLGLSKSGQFDAAAIKAQGMKMAADFATFKTLFPDGSQAGDREARSEIWTDRAGFEATRNKAEAAAVQLAAVQDTAGLKQALDAQAATCKACHDAYRNK